MRLIAPLESIEEVLPLAEAGADELYCGVKVAHAGVEYRPNDVSLTAGNFPSFEALAEAVSMAEARGVSVVFVANSSQGRRTLEWQKRDIAKAFEAGVRKLVLTDLTLIPWVRKAFPDLYIALSILCPVYNAESLAFFARLGIRRFVLDRLRTLREIEEMNKLSKRLGVDLTVFTTPVNCLHIRATCIFHTWYIANLFRSGRDTSCSSGSPCHRELPVSVYGKGASGWRLSGPRHAHPPRGFVGPNCAVCALWFLHERGVPCAKIVGRSFPLEYKLLHLRLAKSYLMKIEKGGVTARNFVGKGRETYREVLGCDCSGRKCFYPEIRSLRERGGRR